MRVSPGSSGSYSNMVVSGLGGRVVVVLEVVVVGSSEVVVTSATSVAPSESDPISVYSLQPIRQPVQLFQALALRSTTLL